MSPEINDAAAAHYQHDADTELARVCHEANRAYCGTLGEDQPAWEDAPDWQRESAILGVRFHRENPEAGPEGSHTSWMNHKVADGWTYGPVKDPDAKTHPCIMPFDQLPPAQQAKDRLFVAIVRALTGPT